MLRDIAAGPSQPFRSAGGGAEPGFQQFLELCMRQRVRAQKADSLNIPIRPKTKLISIERKIPHFRSIRSPPTGLLLCSVFVVITSQLDPDQGPDRSSGSLFKTTLL
jgi:hypothetical protein